LLAVVVIDNGLARQLSVHLFFDIRHLESVNIIPEIEPHIILDCADKHWGVIWHAYTCVYVEKANTEMTSTIYFLY